MSEFTPVQFVDADAQRIENELIEAYQRETGQVLYPGDPRRILLLQLLPVLVALKNDINYTGNQNLLPFAEGQVLDGLGERIGVSRLAAQPARVTMRITLSAIQPGAVSIPRGTRITPDGVIYFATTTDLTIFAGSTTGNVIAESIGGGAKYNGFIAGQINIIVDPIPYVASATNIDTSNSGADEESDAAYRERQRLAPASFSVAGPRDAYVFFAKSADVKISDVAVTSEEPGEVNIYVLMEGGANPSPEVLNKVKAAVTADDRRPLTDYVQVFGSYEIPYNIEFTYYISSERVTEVSSIRAAIENVGGAVDKYVGWQQAKLGRAVTPDDLLSRLYAAGAHRVVVTSPTYGAVNKNEVAIVDTKTIVYGGLI